MEVVINAPNALASAIRDARLRLGLTQAQVAERAMVSQPTLSSLEHGRRQTSLETLTRILAAVDLELLVRERTKAGPTDAWEMS